MWRRPLINYFSGLTGSRTGLAYALVEHKQKGWQVRVGRYPANSRKILTVDEVQHLPDWDLRMIGAKVAGQDVCRPALLVPAAGARGPWHHWKNRRLRKNSFAAGEHAKLPAGLQTPSLQRFDRGASPAHRACFMDVEWSTAA